MFFFCFLSSSLFWCSVRARMNERVGIVEWRTSAHRGTNFGRKVSAGEGRPSTGSYRAPWPGFLRLVVLGGLSVVCPMERKVSKVGFKMVQNFPLYFRFANISLQSKQQAVVTKSPSNNGNGIARHNTTVSKNNPSGLLGLLIALVHTTPPRATTQLRNGLCGGRFYRFHLASKGSSTYIQPPQHGFVVHSV